jgi:methyl-accepting chemotaxis protein
MHWKGLAAGDLSIPLEDLGPEFGKLEQDFNNMVDAMAVPLTGIETASMAVEGGSSEPASSADQLAKRTEQPSTPDLQKVCLGTGQAHSRHV